MNRFYICVSIFLFTLTIFSQPIVTPAPPVNISGTGVSTTYSSQDYTFPVSGSKVIIQHWETRFEGPQYNWIIKQAHVVITPPPKSDIEDIFIWLKEPNEKCDLMDFLPKLNDTGITLAAAVNIDSSPGLNIGGEWTTAVDEVAITLAPGQHPYSDEGAWTVDWDDFSHAAEQKAVLDFFAKWRCPKDCKCGVTGAQDAAMMIEFDVWGLDTQYRLYKGKTLTMAEVREEYKRKLKEKARLKEKETEQSSLWKPPTGTTRIAAVGTVKDEKVKMTSRGGSIGGTVTVENEEGEELITAVPDEDGHFTIDFGNIDVLKDESVLTITHVDSQGNPETSTTVNYIPEKQTKWTTPPVITPPEVTYLENNQLYDIEGSYLGENAEVFITDEEGVYNEQDVVSSSGSFTQYYLDSPVGPSEIVVLNDFGFSEPVEVGVYEFGVTAGKTSLSKNEKSFITGVYEGLPVGTRIIFTNTSENVTLKPKGKGRVSGNDVIFIVKTPNGEVSMDLKAKQAGGWSVNYNLEFPISDE
jgi:hypothetical protein